MESSVPRRIISGDSRPPLVVLTDACLEDDTRRAGIGAVRLDPCGKPERYFAAAVPDDVLAVLQTETAHVITALEVLPVFFVRHLWADELLHRRVFVMVDNNSARFALIKASSPAPSIRRVLKRIVTFHARCPSFIWYGRVPSASNVADGPSRGDVTILQEVGAIEDVIAPNMWRLAFGA